MTLNKNIASMLDAHAHLDGRLAAARDQLRTRSRRPLPAHASLTDHCIRQGARKAAQVFEAARGLGCGLSVGSALRIQAGLCFERLRIGFITRDRSGRWIDLLATGAVLAAKVTTLAVGLVVVVPLAGVIAGIDGWLAAGRQQGPDATRETNPSVDGPRPRPRRWPTSEQLRDVMQRHGERVNAAF